LLTASLDDVKRVWLAAAVAASVGAAAVAPSLASTPTFCSGSALKGSFSTVPGSAAAGSISYLLALRNRSARTCFVTGLPVLRLLGRDGRALPTNARPTRIGIATAVLVRLRPGAWTSVTARFSPDVPGPGEPTAGRQCEPTAYRLRVSARAGSSTVVPIVKPTPVCEHGTLFVSVYVAGRRVVTP
jgi:hypothetical protein